MTTPLQIPIGSTFDKWTVIALTNRRTKDGRQLLVCQCICGVVKDVGAKDLQGKKSKGCLRCRPSSRLRHGHARVGKESPTHFSWRAMLDRCENPKSPSWQWYGAKGIVVCERWHSFDNFLVDMGERPGKAYTLERKNGQRVYCAENCCWATAKEQGRNRSSNLLLTYNTQTLPLVVWAEITGIGAACIRNRLRYGWTEEEALSTPARAHKPYSRVTATLPGGPGAS